MDKIVYRPHGVCSRQIEIIADVDIIKSVNFVGGCSGNTQGVSRLVEGMTLNEAVTRLEGIECGMKGTSCPDQLAKAIIELVNNRKAK